MTHAAKQKWLETAALIIIVFGLATAAGAHPSLAEPLRLFIDFVIWPVDGAQNLATAETRLLAAICGGIVSGLGVMVWLAASRIYPRNPGVARVLILGGITTWFVIDSTGSVLAGAPLNAILNVAFLLMFWIPLWSSDQACEVVE
jgi:hypothetical protein